MVFVIVANDSLTLMFNVVFSMAGAIAVAMSSDVISGIRVCGVISPSWYAARSTILSIAPFSVTLSLPACFQFV